VNITTDYTSFIYDILVNLVSKIKKHKIEFSMFKIYDDILVDLVSKIKKHKTEFSVFNV